MIRVTIELLPGGDRSRAETVGVVEIINDCSGDADVGNYTVNLAKSPRYAKSAGVWKKGRVRGFPRQILGPYDLLYRALAACVAGRNPQCPAPPQPGERLPLFDRRPSTVDTAEPQP